jgi:hypothetical protein
MLPAVNSGILLGIKDSQVLFVEQEAKERPVPTRIDNWLDLEQVA